jgi:anion-transporting  ArsA/GET3 family ATPase
VIVTSPEPEPAREAEFLAEQLAAAGMPAAELIVNRVHEDRLDGRSVEELEGILSKQLGEDLAGRVARNLADFDLLARRDERTVASLSATMASPPAPPAARPTLVPHLDGEVQDLLGLAQVAEYLLC